MNDFLQELTKITTILTGDDVQGNHLVDWRGSGGKCLCIAMPKTVCEVVDVVKLCNTHKVSIVPQGGHTGLVEGGLATDKEVILSTKKLNTIRDVDEVNNTITVEAGCILKDVQDMAQENGRLFPLSLGAEGTCTIGGNLSTNAGGLNVIRYGNTRDMVLGIEVVLPDGRILNALNRLRKNNTGYDLKHLFIGGEGTLGIITAATLKLYPMPLNSNSFFVGIKSPQEGLDLLHYMQKQAPLQRFELLPRLALDLVFAEFSHAKDPLPQKFPWYILGESEGHDIAEHLCDFTEHAVLAQNVQQAQDLWWFREAMLQAKRKEVITIAHDISLPLSSIPEFVDRACDMIAKTDKNFQSMPFGHLGDGNLHFDVRFPLDTSKSTQKQVTENLYDLAHKMGGSHSAEHGIGTLKLDENQKYQDPVELDLMRSIKQTLDPHNIMNPGKVVGL